MSVIRFLSVNYLKAHKVIFQAMEMMVETSEKYTIYMHV